MALFLLHREKKHRLPRAQTPDPWSPPADHAGFSGKSPGGFDKAELPGVEAGKAGRGVEGGWRGGEKVELQGGRVGNIEENGGAVGIELPG